MSFKLNTIFPLVHINKVDVDPNQIVDFTKIYTPQGIFGGFKSVSGADCFIEICFSGGLYLYKRSPHNFEFEYQRCPRDGEELDRPGKRYGQHLYDDSPFAVSFITAVSHLMKRIKEFPVYSSQLNEEEIQMIKNPESPECVDPKCYICRLSADSNSSDSEEPKVDEEVFDALAYFTAVEEANKPKNPCPYCGKSLD